MKNADNAINSIQNASNNLNDVVAETVDQAVTSSQKVIETVVDAAHPAVDKMAKEVHQTVDKIAVVVAKAADTLGVTSQQIKDMPALLTEGCCDHLRDKPLRTIGYALAAGFLVGWLMQES